MSVVALVIAIAIGANHAVSAPRGLNHPDPDTDLLHDAEQQAEPACSEDGVLEEGVIAVVGSRVTRSASSFSLAGWVTCAEVPHLTVDARIHTRHGFSAVRSLAIAVDRHLGLRCSGWTTPSSARRVGAMPKKCQHETHPVGMPASRLTQSD